MLNLLPIDGTLPKFVYVSGINISGSDTTYNILEYQQWTATTCEDDLAPSRDDCPTITYNFRNGQLTNSGTDTFVEFDIYSKQNETALPFSGSTIYFTYSTDVFGINVVDSDNITVTSGTITADTANYKIALNDTLLPSDALPTNGGEVALTITSLDSSSLYSIPDTFQWLCHIKMKMKKKATLEIWYDQFFMQNLSLYNLGGSSQYNYVKTYGQLAMNTDDAVNLYYSLTVDKNTQITNTTLSCTIWALADAQVNMADAAVRVTYDYTALNDGPGIDLSDPDSYWIPDPNDVNGNGIYVSGEIVSHGAYEFDVFQTNGDQAGQMHQWLNYDPSRIDCDVVPVQGEVFFGLTFTGNCAKVPNLAIDALNASLNNKYYDDNMILTNFNVTVCGGYNCMWCTEGLGLRDDCTSSVTSPNGKTVIKVYPNPFNNSMIVSFFLSENADITLTIENLMGQSIYTTSLGNLSPGSFNKDLSIPGNISDGVYILKLHVNNTIRAIKIIKD